MADHDTSRGRPRGRALPRLAAAIALVAMTSTPAFARADEADTLLEDGKKLMKAGKVEEACSKLEQSQKLAPTATTLLNLAACHEKQGKLATAWGEYIDVGAEARKEGNKRLEADAKMRSSKLELRLPRLTLSVPAAVSAIPEIEIKLDGNTIEKSGWGQSRPIDPGDHKVSASAPGRKSWEYPVTIKAGERKALTIPVLAKDGSGTAEPESSAGAAQDDAKPAPARPLGEVPLGKAQTAAAGQPEVGASSQPARRSGRLVVEVGAAGGLLVGLIDRGSLDQSSNYSYEVEESSGGTLIKVCNDDLCEGVFDPGIGVIVGGTGFVGYAVSEEMHLGARLFGAYRFGDGYLLAGGPSGSLRFGSLWLGLTLLAGAASQTSTVTNIKGQVPPELVQYNDGQTEIDVPPGRNGYPETASVGTLALGGTVEISYVLADFRGPNWTSGSLVVSAWPTLMKGLEGFVIAAPVSFGYRFY